MLKFSAKLMFFLYFCKKNIMKNFLIFLNVLLFGFQTGIVAQTTYSTIYDTICSHETYNLNGTLYNSTGVYNNTILNSAGGDSIITLNLFVKPAPSVAILERNVCQDDTVHFVFTGVPPFYLDYTFNNIRQNITVSGMDTMCVVTQTGVNILIIHSLISANGCYFGATDEQGVLINGVIWSTRNVGKPKTFTAKPEDAGMFYQWGKNVGWSTSDPMINTNGSTVWDWIPVPNSENWKPENDPCPCGWRVPTKEEQWDMIGIGSADVIQNGVLGRLSRTDRNSIFLPYAKLADERIVGWRNDNGSLMVFELNDYSNGPPHSDYWAATDNEAWDLCFRFGFPLQERSSKTFCTLVRCVKDATPECYINVDTVMVNSKTFNTILDTIYKCEWYYFGNDSINETGIYVDTVIGQNGCDSIVTLNLLVLPREFNDTLNICINRLPHTIYDTIFSPTAVNGTYIIHHRCATITLLLNVEPKIETYPPDIPIICADDKSFILKFQNTNSPNTKPPTNYKIIFDNHTVPAGFENFENQSNEIGNNNEIIVRMPEKIYPDYYKCKIILSDNVYNCLQQEFDIVLPVLYPDSIMQQKWDDVIALLNYYYNGGFEFSAYQWFQNGKILTGETKSYIYLNGSSLKIGDKYSVLITRPDGSQMFSCDFTAHEPRAECCKFPTIINSNGIIKIPLQDKTAKIRLITVTGIVLLTRTINEENNEIIAPQQQGIYLLEISGNNSKKVVKIIVK